MQNKRGGGEEENRRTGTVPERHHHREATPTDGGQYLHGPHGGLDVEPELLQGKQALAVEVLQLGDQDHVLLHQGPHGRRQGVVHLAVLEG